MLLLAVLLLLPAARALPSPPRPDARLPPAAPTRPLARDLAFALRVGLTLDPCTADADCYDDRLCYKLTPSGFDLCRARDTLCFCRPPQFVTCKNLRDCINGEVCAATALQNQAICVSQDAEEEYSNINEASEFPTAPTRPTRRPTPPQEARTPTPSARPAEVEISPSVEPTPEMENDPLPTPTPEQTLDPADDGFPSSSPTPTPGRSQPSEPSEDNVCIDASVLSHLSADELVFKSHAWSRVLCDENGSCATPGHIVRFRGKPMMMRAFCGIVGCVEKSMHVNSPRYRRRAFIKAKTKDLVYTAFAARYESRVEEAVIAAALAFGL